MNQERNCKIKKKRKGPSASFTVRNPCRTRVRHINMLIGPETTVAHGVDGGLTPPAMLASAIVGRSRHNCYAVPAWCCGTRLARLPHLLRNRAGPLNLAPATYLYTCTRTIFIDASITCSTSPSHSLRVNYFQLIPILSLVIYFKTFQLFYHVCNYCNATVELYSTLAP